jgi:hypothetical protein
MAQVVSNYLTSLRLSSIPSTEGGRREGGKEEGKKEGRKLIVFLHIPNNKTNTNSNYSTFTHEYIQTAILPRQTKN